MKFGFNIITDEAKAAIESVGLHWQYNGSGAEIWTDTYDEIMDERKDRDIVVDDAGDMQRRYRAQGIRMKKLEDGRYIYLIRDTAFFMYKKLTKDYSADTVTIIETSIFDVFTKEEQDRWRNVLMSQDIAVNRPLI